MFGWIDTTASGSSIDTLDGAVTSPRQAGSVIPAVAQGHVVVHVLLPISEVSGLQRAPN